MQFSKRGNVLLLELLIVIVFFMIGSTILMRMFGRSHMMSRRADALTRSVGEASSMADTLMASGDVQAALDRMGAVRSEEGYTISGDGITYIVSFESEPEKTGEAAVLEGKIRALWQEEELLSLPVAAVLEGQ